MDIASLIDIKKNPKIPDIAPGDTVKVSARIMEAGKERIQVFQGVVLKIKRGGTGASFTVRHVAYGIGVERTFPLNSPLVEKVEVVRQGKVRRSRLYYLRSLSGKEARRKIKRVQRKVRQVGEELIEAEPEEVLEPEDVLQAEPEAAEEEAETAIAEEAEEATAEVAEPEAVVEEEAEAVVGEKPEEAVEEKPEAVATEEATAEAPEPEPEAVVEAEPVAEEEAKAATEEPEAEAPAMEKEEAVETPAESTEESEKETS